MRTDRQKALRLRLQGRSYSEIQATLGGISKSTLSLWLKEIVISKEAIEALGKRTQKKSLEALLKRNKNQTNLAIQRKTKHQDVARAQIDPLSMPELLLIGAALYWAEGYKRPRLRGGHEITSHPISLTNADPKLLRMFLRFISEICSVPREKIRISIRIFKHLNPEHVLAYWSNILEMPRENFTKPTVVVSRSSMGKKPFNRLPYGVVQIRINDTNLFHTIMGWIEGVKEQC
jgi:hypothetical protein